VARYQVESRPGGPVGRLEVTRRDLAPADLRSWLADRLDHIGTMRGRHEATGVAFFDGNVAVEGGRLRLSLFRFGPHPAPDDWPRVPLPELLRPAAEELRRP
jgi:hypothetical protein